MTEVFIHRQPCEGITHTYENQGINWRDTAAELRSPAKHQARTWQGTDSPAHLAEDLTSLSPSLGDSSLPPYETLNF